MSEKLLFAIIIIVAMSFMGFVGYKSFPFWCDHPEIGGNHYVQPFCKYR